MLGGIPNAQKIGGVVGGDGSTQPHIQRVLVMGKKFLKKSLVHIENMLYLWLGGWVCLYR
jgi:hypothetical protein